MSGDDNDNGGDRPLRMWAVCSPWEPPTALHVTVHAAANMASLLKRQAAPAGAKPQMLVCHFAVSPLPAPLVVFWTGIAGNATLQLHAAVDRDAVPRLIGQASTDHGAIGLDVAWTNDEVAFAKRNPDKMGKLVAVLTAMDDVGTSRNLLARSTPTALSPPNSDPLQPESPVAARASGAALRPSLAALLDAAPATPPVTPSTAKVAPQTPVSILKRPRAPTSESRSRPHHVVFAPDDKLVSAREFMAVDGKADVAVEIASEEPAAIILTQTPADDDSDDFVTPKRPRRQPVRSSPAAPSVVTPAVVIPTPAVFADAPASHVPDAVALDDGWKLVRRSTAPTNSAVLPPGRWGHTMVADPDRHCLIVVGGQGEKQELVDERVWMCDAAGEWRACDIANEGPGRRMGHTAVLVNGQMLVFGGSKYKRWYSDMWRLDLSKKQWEAVTTSGKVPPIAYHTLNVHNNNQLIAFGGISNTACSNALYAFDIAKANWFKPRVSGCLPSARSGHTATLLGDLLVVIGGWDDPELFPMSDVFILDLLTFEFTKHAVPGECPPPRSWHTATLLANGEILVYGGFNGNDALRDAFVLCNVGSENMKWKKVTDALLPTGRAGHAAAVRANSVVVFGGGDNEGRFFNSVEQFESVR